jgi:IclR family transcriptional regulator, acetate operon repressor
MALQGRDFIGDVRPVMERLSDVSRESVHLGVLDSFEVVHVGKVDSPEMVGVASKVGTRAVPHVTALGKALLAARPDDVVVGHIDHAHVLPATHRLSDIDQLMGDLRRVRDRGFCLDEEEPSAGIRCLGVSILGADGTPLFALSINGPAARFSAHRAAGCAPEAISAAGTLSALFGWSTPPTAQAASGSR